MSSLAATGARVGSYQMIRQIGQGGMGEVWLAEHVLLKRNAAIKLLRPNLSASTEMVTRFFNEARAAAAISDPGIVQIFDFGQRDDGSAYIVMELLEGEALDARLRRVGVLPVADALRTMRQVASSLGAAHARNIIHRDLKPENIFLVRDAEVAGGERAKLLDFGIAKLTDDQYALKTQTAALLGTPMYMSPEQCRGAGQIDQRCDVYSLGCVLFTLITGRPPFEATNLGDMIAQHLMEPPPAASQHGRGIPRGVDELIARCLAKQPAERFASGAELAAAIDAIAQLLPSAQIARGSVPPTIITTSHPVAQVAATVPPTILPVRASQLAATVAPLGFLPPPPIADLRANTTLSRSAIATTTPPERRVSPRIVAALAGVTVAGGLASWLALRPGAEDPVLPVAAAPAPIVAPAAPAPARTVPAPESPETRAAHQLAGVLRAFRTWSATHASAACPSSPRELAGGLEDPWGHPFAITCTDQPSDQIVGVVSLGPDGIAGTRDDLKSWELGTEVTDLVRGARWKPVAPAIVRAPARPVPPVKPPPPGKTFHGTTLGSDGIPTTR